MLRDTVSASRQERLSDASMSGKKNYALAWKHAAHLYPDPQSTGRAADILHRIVNSLTTEKGRVHKMSNPRET